MTETRVWYPVNVLPVPVERVQWAKEGAIALVVVAYLAMLGSVVGVVWHALAPQVGIVEATEGSSAAMKALIGDDVWLGALGLVAGIISVALLLVVAGDWSRGPGAMIGLAVGGLLGMLVAARVGHLLGHRDLTAALKGGFPGITPKGLKLVLGYFDFSVRAKAVLVSWPLASVLLNAAIIGVRSAKGAPSPTGSAYPGTS